MFVSVSIRRTGKFWTGIQKAFEKSVDKKCFNHVLHYYRRFPIETFPPEKTPFLCLDFLSKSFGYTSLTNNTQEQEDNLV